MHGTTAIIDQFNKRQQLIGTAIAQAIIASEHFQVRKVSLTEYSTKMIHGMLSDGKINLVQEENAQTLDDYEAMERFMNAVYNLKPKHGTLMSVEEIIHGAIQGLHERGISLFVASDDFLDEFAMPECVHDNA